MKGVYENEDGKLYIQNTYGVWVPLGPASAFDIKEIPKISGRGAPANFDWSAFQNEYEGQFTPPGPGGYDPRVEREVMQKEMELKQQKAREHRARVEKEAAGRWVRPMVPSGEGGRIGYRSWQWDETGGLRSIGHGSFYLDPGIEFYEAVCDSGNTQHATPAPAYGCTCGYYALREPGPMVGFYNTQVYGVIRGRERIMLHSLGFKMQYMEILAFYVSESKVGTDPLFEHDTLMIGALYDRPVFMHTPTPEDVLRRIGEMA